MRVRSPAARRIAFVLLFALAGCASTTQETSGEEATPKSSITTTTAPKPISTTAAVDPNRRAEIEAFVARLDDANREGDVSYQVSRLHPSTFTFWTVSECETSIGTWEPGLYIDEILDIWSIPDDVMNYGNGRRAEFDHAYRVGGTTPDGRAKTMTVSFVNEVPTWFMNCDLPVSGSIES